MNVSILGTRGIPAQHGGFETFAEHLAIFLHSRGHRVTVYCQGAVDIPLFEDEWHGIQRVTIYGSATPLGTIAFDCAAVFHASRRSDVILTLGYNTAIFSLFYKLSGNRSLMNMDGLEWTRDKWSHAQRLWLRINERLGACLSDHLIADHPAIGAYLAEFTRNDKITVIPYECEPITDADPAIIEPYGLVSQEYLIVIARPEPENSLLDIVRAFSRRKRGVKLFILGKYYPEAHRYHRLVMESAGEEVVFAGAIYDHSVVRALRLHARAYIHGHRVGGTNPSLVEALAAGNPIIAHDNPFTRWVAGPDQQYFTTADDLSDIFDTLIADREKLDRMSIASRVRHQQSFTPERVLPVYESVLLRYASREESGAAMSVQVTTSRESRR